MQPQAAEGWTVPEHCRAALSAAGRAGDFLLPQAQIKAALSAAGGSQGRAHRAVDRIEYIAFPRKTDLGFGGCTLTSTMFVGISMFNTQMG